MKLKGGVETIVVMSNLNTQGSFLPDIQFGCIIVKVTSMSWLSVLQFEQWLDMALICLSALPTVSSLCLSHRVCRIYVGSMVHVLLQPPEQHRAL